jgi:Fe-S-cluster-containing hydrogenase component 2
MKIISSNPNKCTGCRLCELACSMKKAGEYNPTRANIQVIGYDELLSVPLTCFQCEKPYCLEVCPARAISRNETTGAVYVEKQRCVGCKMCTLACPFGNIAVSTIEKVAVKCDLCDGEPECVLFCPTGALEYKEADTSAIRKKIALSERIKEAYNRQK